MASVFPPAAEDALVTSATVFQEKITDTPTVFSLTAAQATANGLLLTDFLAKRAVCLDPATKTRLAVELKDVSKANLVENLRMLARIVQNAPTTTNAMRIDLGLPERDDEPTPAEQITEMPALTVLKIQGRNVRIRVRDASGERRGKPSFADGCLIFSYVGETPPASYIGWTSEGNLTKDSAIVAFPAAVPVGAKVWFAAMWYNTKGAGPGCTPVAAVIGAEGSMAA
jgi:hypothetical protein